MPSKPRLRERDIENRVVDYAKRRHCLCYKFSSPSHRGVCDRIIIIGGEVLFLELKRPGEKPTALQTKFLTDVNKHGGTAKWADSVEGAVEHIDNLIIDSLLS